MPDEQPTTDRRGLIALDLDGTLLRPDGSISERNAAAVRAAADAGWWVVLATGRPPHLVLDLADELAGAVTHVVGGNGSIVGTFPATPDGSSDLLHLASFDVATAHDIVRHLRSVDDRLGFALATDGGFGHEPGFAERMPAPVTDDPIDDVLTVGGDSVFKLLVFHHDRPVDDLVQTLPPHVDAALSARGRSIPGHGGAVVSGDTPTPAGRRGGAVVSGDTPTPVGRFHVVHMGADAAEIGPAEVDKRAGLSWLCEHLGVDQADTIGFGDEGNDLTMLSWVGTGYAMANAPADVQAVADHLAPHHLDDGVAQVLEQLLR